jgi:thiosulfate dehydrogenase [quinone] large subunit
MRLACASGALLYILMYTVALPPANHPFLDEHMLGAVTLVVLGLTYAGNTWGFGRIWTRLSVVRSHAALR